MNQEEVARTVGNSVLRLLSLRQKLAITEYTISKRAREIKGATERCLGVITDGVRVEFGGSDYQALREGYLLSSDMKVADALRVEIEKEHEFLANIGIDVKERKP